MIAFRSDPTVYSTHFSSIEEKRVEESIIVQKWIVDDKTVILHLQGEKLIWEVINAIGAVINTDTAPPMLGVSTAELVKFLSGCEIALHNDMPQFLKPSSSTAQRVIQIADDVLTEKDKRDLVHKWSVEGKTFILLRRKENLYRDENLKWKIIDERNRVENSGLAPLIPGVSIDALANFLSACKVEYYNDKPKFLPPNSPRTVRQISQLDNKKFVDKNFRAVTLVSVGKDWYGHAEIIIEGINKRQQYFVKIAHLRSGNIECSSSRKYVGVMIGDVDIVKNHKPSFHSKSQTWLKSKECVKKMLAKIKVEKSKEEPVYFNFLAHTKSAVNIVTGEEYKSDNRSLRSSFATCFWPDCSNLFDSDYLAYLKTIRKVNEAVLPVWRKLKHEGWYDLGEGNKPHQWAVQDVGKSKKGKRIYREIMMPDNCLTWALRKLSMLGIDLSEEMQTLFKGKAFPITPKHNVGHIVKNNGESTRFDAFHHRMKEFKEKHPTPPWAVKELEEIKKKNLTKKEYKAAIWDLTDRESKWHLKPHEPTIFERIFISIWLS